MKDLTANGASSGFPSCLLCHIPTTDPQAICPECRRREKIGAEVEREISDLELHKHLSKIGLDDDAEKLFCDLENLVEEATRP